MENPKNWRDTEITGIDSKEVSKVIKKVKNEGKVVSPEEVLLLSVTKK